MNLVEVLVEQSRLRPNSAAIIETVHGRDIETSYAGLERRSGRMAAMLRRSGVTAGDPVLIFHPMSAELYAVLLGVFRINAVAMFLDPSAGREHIERCCELQTPAALIASPKAHLLRFSSGALRRIPRKYVVGPWLPGARPLADALWESPMEGCESCEPLTPALLTFTSGSTGPPKAAVRTHGFLLAQHQVLLKHIQLVAGEVDLATLPIFMLANLASGLTSVIPEGDLRSPGAITPGPILAQIERLRVTRCTASPAFFERILGAPAANKSKLLAFQKVYTGGAPVFPRLLESLGAAAPSAQVEAVYGSTEAEPIAHLDARQISPLDRQAMRRGGGLLTGRPIPEIQLRIIPDQWGHPIGPFSQQEFKRLQLPEMRPGEIVVSGDHVLKGYLQGRGDEETKFRAGEQIWHRTGDAGKLDQAGRLWLLGRCSAKIHDERGEIYPFAVECAAMENAEIRRAAFVAHAGQRLLAIESGTKLGPDGLRKLREEADWAQIDAIRRIDRLPVDKRHNAKIDYPALRRQLGS